MDTKFKIQLNKKCSARIFWTIAVLLTSIGCSNPLGEQDSVVDKDYHPGASDPPSPTFLAPARSAELVAGSAQMIATNTHRFKLQATISSPTGQVRNETSARNYILFSNVQGELLSEGQ